MYINDTIAAISTPLGEGGIGVIRISGERAGAIGAGLFMREPGGGFESHRFYYGSIIDPADGTLVDEVLLVLMRAPRSYTREDILEIHCHGGYLLVQRLLSLVLRQGARLAEPGEFTRRAFLNGRIDLVQAEAVIDVIRGKTEAALSLAQHQREGVLSRELGQIRGLIIKTLALTEAYIDFSDEDLGTEPSLEIHGAISEALDRCKAMLAGYDEGKALRDGVSVVIAGKPNAGKSSLMNTLLKEKRAIVTSVPGTTRDVIEEVVNIRGLPVKLLDTAGICETDDIVEKEGVRLALEKISRADLVLLLFDASRPLEGSDLYIMQQLGEKAHLKVMNKCDLPMVIDLPAHGSGNAALNISTKSGAGIEGLHKAIYDFFIHGHAVDSREYVALSNARHRDGVEKCRDVLTRIKEEEAAEGSLEILAAELREALHWMDEITGEGAADEVLDLVFQRFCIGK